MLARSARPGPAPAAICAAPARRPLAALLSLSILTLAPALARAEEELPVRVVVRPNGASFRIDPGAPEGECPGQCVLHLKRGVYTFVAPGVSQEIKLEGPAQLEYHPGSEAWRTAGLVMILGGVLVAGGTAWAAVKVCSETSSTSVTGAVVADRPCLDGANAERNKAIAEVLGVTAAVGFTSAVVGTFAYFLSTPGLSVDMQRPPRPGGMRPDWGLSNGPGALGLGAWARF